MNPEAIAAITIPTFLFGIPLAWVILHGWQKVVRLRIEEAHARASLSPAAEDSTLRADVDQLKRELGEVQERLDFAERILARGTGDRPDRLPEQRR